MNGIVVGVDGSAGSQRALLFAIEEAQHRQMPLTVVTAVNVIATPSMWGAPVPYPEPGPADFERAKAAASEMVDKVKAEYGKPVTVDVTVKAIEGPPAAALVEIAEDADLLVVGSRGAGGFSRLLLGSVSTAVVHHAKCPVTVVRGHNGEH